MNAPDLQSAGLAPDAVVEEAFRPANSPRRVLVYAPLAYWTPHFETDLEVAQRHLDLGDHVEMVLCDGELSSCQFNPRHDAKCCLMCISRNLQGVEQLSTKVEVVGLVSQLQPQDHQRLAQLPELFPDVDALKRYRFEGFDAGMATLSSMIDFLRNPVVDTVAYAPVINRSLFGAVSSYLAFLRLLDSKRYERVYIFNGRWSMVRSAVRACELKGVSYYTHERAADVRKFSLYKNCLPHDMGFYRAQVRIAWERNHQHPDFERIGESFFLERRARVERTWFSFLKSQEAGRVPEDWNRGKRRILFCTSSEFEFAAIDEGTLGRVYPTQLVAAASVARQLSKADPEAHLWIRIHPNDNTPETVRSWNELAAAHANVTVVLPDAKVDSYSMIEGAERVFGFGSTIGIEASYWGRPSICAEHSFYGGMDAQYEASSEQELLDLLLTPGLAPKPRTNAVSIGFYLNTFGDWFKYFDTQTISDTQYTSTFRGFAIKPDIADLYRRLVGLLEQGDLRRAATISRLAVEFTPDNAVMHSVRILSLLKLHAADHAIAALDEARRVLPPAQLDQLLGNTAKAFLDLSMQLSSSGQLQDFKTKAGRIAHIFASVPRFAAIGQRLLQMVNQASVNRPAQATTQPLSQTQR